MLPADPGVKHEQDPLQDEPVIERLPTRIAKAALAARQERLDPRPQPVGDDPRRPHRHPPFQLDDGCPRLRYPEPGPFIELEVLSPRKPRVRQDPSVTRRAVTLIGESSSNSFGAAWAVDRNFADVGEMQLPGLVDFIRVAATLDATHDGQRFIGYAIERLCQRFANANPCGTSFITSRDGPSRPRGGFSGVRGRNLTFSTRN
jgi:hypothetical protein